MMSEQVTNGKLGLAGSATQNNKSLIDIAEDLESMVKTTSLKEAERLAQNVEVNCFKLGGILKLINEHSWFDGFPTFDHMVSEKLGFAGRTAHHLMHVYDILMTKQVPCEKIADVGWTKLKDLARVLTQENADEWVITAEKLTVFELRALLKAGTPVEAAQVTASTTDGVVKITFKLKKDQVEVIKEALAKAKGELRTAYDAVALENICAAYLGGLFTVAKVWYLDEVIKAIGFQPLLERVAELFPEYDICVSPAKQIA